MDSETDTESEADHLAAAPHPTRMALSPFVSPPADTCSNLKGVYAALQDLRTVETSLLRKVPRT